MHLLEVDFFRGVAFRLQSHPGRCTPCGRLHAMAEVIVRYALRHPHRYRLLWRGDNFASEGSAAEIAGTVPYDRVKAVLGAAEGRTGAAIDSQVIAAWSLIYGYVSLRLEGALVDRRDEMSGRSRASAIVDVLIDGLEAELGKRRTS